MQVKTYIIFSDACIDVIVNAHNLYAFNHYRCNKNGRVHFTKNEAISMKLFLHTNKFL